MSRARLAELVSAAAYGSVLTLAALTVLGVSDIGDGHSAELIAGVGGATWVAHLFAELLGGHVHDPEPLRRSEVARAAVDGSPIFAATVLPAIALLAGRTDIIGDDTARTVAIVVATIQLLSIAAFVGRITPARPNPGWSFVIVSTGLGLVVVVLTVALGH